MKVVKCTNTTTNNNNKLNIVFLNMTLLLDTEAKGHVTNDKTLIGQQDLSKAYLITGWDDASHGNTYSYAEINPLFGLMIYDERCPVTILSYTKLKEDFKRVWGQPNCSWCRIDHKNSEFSMKFFEKQTCLL